MDTNIALLPAEAWNYIHASLNNGTGLTVACEGMNISVKAMSEFLAKTPRTLDRLTAECVMGYKSIMTIINNSAADQKLKGWKDGHVALREFVKTVNLWEQHCKQHEITAQNISEAFYTYRLVPEVATVTGYTVEAFYRYILADKNLTAYLIKSKFITG